MDTPPTYILTINGGSSSIKFGLYQSGSPVLRLWHGQIDRIGEQHSTLRFKNENGTSQGALPVAGASYASAANFLLTWLEMQPDFQHIRVVGHRVVHGWQRNGPEWITTTMLDELRGIIPYDPAHLPNAIALIERFRQGYPQLPQLACFDTAFHRSMPRVAQLLPIPRRFDAKGIHRYGFHGLSYAFLMEELARVAGSEVAKGRVILAHLGNGASLAAVCDGKSVDTTMGLTPASGLVMGSRPGDLDPGVACFLIESEHLNPEQFNHLINHESGLLGISETSSDMRDLLRLESHDVRAAEAVALFCYQVKKGIGAFAAVLGGLDTLVFAGGIGENCPTIRSRICAGLGFLGIELDETQNRNNTSLISIEHAQVGVRVLHTDEEWMIATTVSQQIYRTGLPASTTPESINTYSFNQ